MCASSKQESDNQRPKLSILVTPSRKTLTLTELNERMLTETVELEKELAKLSKQFSC